jgi:hypothetical protein
MHTLSSQLLVLAFVVGRGASSVVSTRSLSVGNANAIASAMAVAVANDVDVQAVASVHPVAGAAVLGLVWAAWGVACSGARRPV